MKKIFKQFTLILTLSLLAPLSTFASHIIGGNFEFCQTGANTFELTLRIFRDCNPTNSTTITPSGIRIYDNVTNLQPYTESLNGNLISTTVISLGDSCYTPTGVCVEQRVYTKTITLADNPNGYYIAWDICCRNNLITNIDNPTSSGSTFYVQIPDPALAGGNCSPNFGSYPTDGYFCLTNDINNPFIIDPMVTDADGDSLVYSLVDPYDDGNSSKPFQSITWATGGYSLANILGNTTLPAMSINSSTGIITCYPENIGVFVFAIMVEEYRNGVKIGEIVRDVQYSALGCTLDSPPVINLADTVAIYVGDTICVDMTVSDSDGADTIYVTPTSLDFDLAGTYIAPTNTGTSYLYDNFNNTGVADSMLYFQDLGTVYQGVGEILLRYCWAPECGDLDSTYHVNLLAYSLGCSGSDTTQKEVVFDVVHDAAPAITLDGFTDTISVTVGDLICFDLMIRDTVGTDTLSINIQSPNFDLPGNYIQPQTINGEQYYTNFFSTDTTFFDPLVWNTDFDQYQGVGLVPFRYCLTPGCETIDETFELDLAANTIGCGSSDTVYQTLYVDIQYQPDSVAFDIPDNITVSFDTEICFELLTNDINQTGFPLSIEPINSEFDYQNAYVTPNNDVNGYYYTNFQGMDTLRIDNYSYANGIVQGVDTVAIRYCWTPQCGDVVLQNYHLDYKATLHTTCFNFSETKAMNVVVDPPVGEVKPIPNIFTPNGDDQNEFFELTGSNDPCFDEMEVTIYNRWGRKVFESTDPEFQWNGTNKGGKDCAEGVYFVVVKGTYGSKYDPATGTRIPNSVDKQYTVQLMR